ncbi:hypothetical protein [Ilumatobacter sp.]|uniref:hypothetical protein n=1 Tax=Ilumatobacter sp. TaxID=1967498 RepID=UPI003B5246B5
MQRIDPTPRRRRAAGFLTVAVAVVAALLGPITTGPARAQAPGSTVISAADPVLTASAFRPINPVRVLDTRLDRRIARLWVESALTIDPVTGTGVAAAAGVDPDRITAVVVNVTMIDSGAISDRPNGFGTVWPTGARRPVTSTNNTEFEGHTIPNLVIAPLGTERKISVFASTDADVALDVLGVFVASDATAAGRFEPLPPRRALDTRRSGTTDFAPGETRTVDLTAVGVPSSASAVVMNVTAIRSRGRGFYRVWSSGDPRPGHSNVNVLDAGYQAGNQVISKVTDGRVDVQTDVGGGLTIDVTGYFTGSGDAVSTDGLFVPFTPGRLLDTRRRGGTTGLTGGERLAAGRTFALDVAGRLAVPAAGASAVALNLTAIRAADRGFVTAFATSTAQPGTSSLNFTTGGQTVPNHAITSIDQRSGDVSLVSSSDTHLAVDATGYFVADGAGLPPRPPTSGAGVEIASIVPAPLPATPASAGPYDLLKDRAAFLDIGLRPNPTLKLSWAACRPFRYALNIDLARSDAQIAVLVEAIEEVEEATGIDFQFAGVTSAGMNLDTPLVWPESFDRDLPFRYLPPDPAGGVVDGVIGYSRNDDTTQLSPRGVIGTGGSLSTATDANGRSQAVRGFAVIDLDELEDDGPNGARTLANLAATTTHEIGHMMGLAHISVDAPGLAGGFSDAVVRDQLMFPFLNISAGVDLDDGDRRGLHELYRTGYCPPAMDFLTDRSASVDGSAAGGEPDLRDGEIVLVADEAG